MNYTDPYGLEGSNDKKSFFEKLTGYIPEYGKYGGPGHSGPGTPDDQMDERFEHHDYHYTNRQYLQGDVEVVEDLKNIPLDPRTWNPPAKNPEYAKWYRNLATDWVTNKLKQYEKEKVEEAQKNRCKL